MEEVQCRSAQGKEVRRMARFVPGSRRNTTNAFIRAVETWNKALETEFGVSRLLQQTCQACTSEPIWPVGRNRVFVSFRCKTMRGPLCHRQQAQLVQYPSSCRGGDTQPGQVLGPSVASPRAATINRRTQWEDGGVGQTNQWPFPRHWAWSIRGFHRTCIYRWRECTSAAWPLYR